MHRNRIVVEQMVDLRMRASKLGTSRLARPISRTPGAAVAPSLIWAPPHPTPSASTKAHSGWKCRAPQATGSRTSSWSSQIVPGAIGQSCPPIPCRRKSASIRMLAESGILERKSAAPLSSPSIGPHVEVRSDCNARPMLSAREYDVVLRPTIPRAAPLHACFRAVRAGDAFRGLPHSRARRSNRYAPVRRTHVQRRSNCPCNRSPDRIPGPREFAVKRAELANADQRHGAASRCAQLDEPLVIPE